MANYADSSFCDTYFTTKLNTESWDEASDEEKTAALTMATDSIDRLNYLGEKTDPDQENQFPRDADTIVPEDIQKACAEIALRLLDGVDPEIEFENLSMVSQGYANVRSTYDRSQLPPHLVAGIVSVTAWRFLKPFLRDWRGLAINRVS